MTVSSGPRQRLTETMFDVVAEHGLERLSVREIATRAGVSIGAVQHHFPTKDAMLVAAFDEVVARTRRRVDELRFGPDVRANVTAVLMQLLPIDPERAAEARVHLAFAARAAVSADLARIQGGTLRGIEGELAAAIGAAPARDGSPLPELAARLLLAGVDGLALHAVSSGRTPGTRRLQTAASALVDAVLR